MAQIIQMARRKPLTLADLKPREYQEVCTSVHEAGHAVLGVLMGGQLFSAAVHRTRTMGLDGVTRFDDLRTTRRNAVAYAGPFAQARFCAGGRRHPGIREIDRVLDNGGCRDMSAITASGGATADVAPEVAALVARCWAPVIDVAKQLYREGEVRHSDVCAALAIPEVDNGFHLSLIHSGSVPGTFTVRDGVTA
jgi:hypothetical protein